MNKLLLLAILIPTLLFGNEVKKTPAKLFFEENVGQVNLKNYYSSLIVRGSRSNNPEIRFILKGGARTYFFSDRGYSVVQNDKEGTVSRTDFFFQNSLSVLPEAKNRNPYYSNYYTGKGNFHSDSYEKLIYKNVFSGTDLEFSIQGDYLEQKLITNGAAVRQTLTFDISGPDSNRDYGNSNQRNGGNQEIQSSSLSWLTYLGGTSADDLFGVALTADSGVVVTGRTGSIDFPSTPGSFQDTLSLSYDAVVARFDSSGNCLWSTYYGGTNFDGAYQVIVLDSAIVITGMSNSTDLPMLNPTQVANGGSYDAFILMLNGAGQLIRSTYYGGTGADQGLCMAKGNAGEIVIGGSVTSTDLPFASAGYQGTNGGMADAFVAVFDDSLNVQWASYYGGNNVEDIHAITVTAQNEIAFVGGTRSFNFPVTPNAWQSGLLNQPDNYLVKFGMNGTRHYATFFGGTNNEDANAVESDGDGNLYVTGFTFSADFPTQGTIFQSNLLGQQDVFVSRFDSTGQLVWSTFVGGGGQDVGWGITRLGRYIFVCGQTESPTFPVSANAIQSVYAINGDAFVIKMDTSGQMISGTFMGGNGVDAFLGITVDSDTNVYAVGSTYSTDLPVTPGAYQMTNATNGDGLVVKFGMSEQLIGMSDFSDLSANMLTVFPNPSNGNVMVSIQQGRITGIDVLDMTGRIVRSQTENSEMVSLDISQLTKGVYFLRVMDTNSSTHVLRIIRE